MPRTGRIGPDFATMRLNRGPCHGQPEAAAARTVFIDGNAIETLKDAVELFGCNAHAPIADTQAEFDLVDIKLNGNQTARLRILNRVVEQMVDGLLDAHDIAENRWH